jgi:hypothetical protein
VAILSHWCRVISNMKEHCRRMGNSPDNWLEQDEDHVTLARAAEMCMPRYRVTIKELVCEYILETNAGIVEDAIQRAEARSTNGPRLYWYNDMGEVQYEVELLEKGG